MGWYEELHKHIRDAQRMIDEQRRWVALLRVELENATLALNQEQAALRKAELEPLPNVYGGQINIHGHTHGNWFPFQSERHFDVSVERTAFGPVLLDDIIEKGNDRIEYFKKTRFLRA